MERNSPVEPEFSKQEKELAAISGMKFALVAVAGVSLAVAAKIARKHYAKAKKEAAKQKMKE
jgi:hypothetical protein